MQKKKKKIKEKKEEEERKPYRICIKTVAMKTIGHWHLATFYVRYSNSFVADFAKKISTICALSFVCQQTV